MKSQWKMCTYDIKLVVLKSTHFTTVEFPLLAK